MTNAKRGKIAPYQLFFIIFVSRILISLTHIQTVSVGKLSTDILISVAMAYLLTIIISIPAYLCVIKNKNPFDNKFVSCFYAVYFIYSAAVNISRFSYFAVSELNPDTSILFFVVIIIFAAAYCAVMGIEALGRFGVFCGAILITALAGVFVFNIKNFEVINFYPVIANSKANILKNAVYFASNSIEPALILSLGKRVNGNLAKPIFYSYSASFSLILLTLLFCNAVMGASASLQAYPIFTLFQMASVGSMSRFDMFHTGFWVLGLLLKTSVLIYSSTLCLKKLNHTKKTVFFSAGTFVFSVLITKVVGTAMIQTTKEFNMILYAVFILLLPVLGLIFKKKGDITIETV